MKFTRLIGLCVLAIANSAFAAQPLTTDMITVVDESNKPVPNATILLGYESGNPFPGNVFSTDAKGTAAIPGEWKAALPLTVQAPGFITSTLPVAMPGVQTLHLIRQEPSGEIEISGDTGGYGNLEEDGWVDFGLTMPAMKREQMMGFDLSSIISPHSDVISVIGNRVEIPSNIAVPEQVETYIFPITISKQWYRTFVRQAGTYKIGITHGRFPMQNVVDDIRNGKSIFEVINYFDFHDFGTRTVTASGNTGGQDLHAGKTPLNATFAVKAPAYGRGLDMVALSIIEKNGLMLPMDLKRFLPGQSINLRTNRTAGDGLVMAVLVEAANTVSEFTDLMNQWFTPLYIKSGLPQNLKPLANQPDFKRLSFALLPTSRGGVAPTLLPLIGKPSVSGQILSIQPPALLRGLTEAGMFATLAEIEEIPNGKLTVERRTRVWEIQSDAWLRQLELPKVAFHRKPRRKYRWEIIFLARPPHFVDEKAPGTRVDLKTITHASLNSVEI